MRLTAFTIAAMLYACPPCVEAATTFIVVRHAEKADEPGRDPALGNAGQMRAQRLADTLADADLATVYSSDYRRTRQTVAPTAQAHALDVSIYDASQPASEFTDRLKAEHREGSVLIAGHSNTVPEIVAALCGCTVEAMPESEYDRLSLVRIEADGTASLQVRRYGEASVP